MGQSGKYFQRRGGNDWETALGNTEDIFTFSTEPEACGLATEKNFFLQKLPGKVVLLNDSHISVRFYKKVTRRIRKWAKSM